MLMKELKLENKLCFFCRVIVSAPWEEPCGNIYPPVSSRADVYKTHYVMAVLGLMRAPCC